MPIDSGRKIKCAPKVFFFSALGQLLRAEFKTQGPDTNIPPEVQVNDAMTPLISVQLNAVTVG